jgi:hypothetical protein
MRRVEELVACRKMFELWTGPGYLYLDWRLDLHQVLVTVG